MVKKAGMLGTCKSHNIPYVTLNEVFGLNESSRGLRDFPVMHKSSNQVEIWQSLQLALPRLADLPIQSFIYGF
jgi:hypothetical protein